MTTRAAYMAMIHNQTLEGQTKRHVRRLKRDKRSTAIRLAMRRIRAERRAQGLNGNGTPWGGKDAKFVPKKWRNQ